MEPDLSLRPSELQLLQQLAASNILVAQAVKSAATVTIAPGPVPWTRVLVFNSLFVLFGVGLQALFVNLPEQNVSLNWFKVAVWVMVAGLILLFTGIIVWMYRRAQRLGPYAIFDGLNQTLRLPRSGHEYAAGEIRGLQIIHARPKPHSGQKSLPRTEMNILTIENGIANRRALLASSLGRSCYDDLVAAVEALGFVPIVRVTENSLGSKSRVSWKGP